VKARPLPGSGLLLRRFGVEKQPHGCYPYKTFILKMMHLLLPFKALVVNIPG